MGDNPNKLWNVISLKQGTNPFNKINFSDMIRKLELFGSNLANFGLMSDIGWTETAIAAPIQVSTSSYVTVQAISDAATYSQGKELPTTSTNQMLSTVLKSSAAAAGVLGGATSIIGLVGVIYIIFYLIQLDTDDKLFYATLNSILEQLLQIEHLIVQFDYCLMKLPDTFTDDEYKTIKENLEKLNGIIANFYAYFNSLYVKKEAREAVYRGIIQSINSYVETLPCEYAINGVMINAIIQGFKDSEIKSHSGGNGPETAIVVPQELADRLHVNKLEYFNDYLENINSNVEQIVDQYGKDENLFDIESEVSPSKDSLSPNEEPTTGGGISWFKTLGAHEENVATTNDNINKSRENRYYNRRMTSNNIIFFYISLLDDINDDGFASKFENLLHLCYLPNRLFFNIENKKITNHEFITLITKSLFSNKNIKEHHNEFKKKYNTNNEGYDRLDNDNNSWFEIYKEIIEQYDTIINDKYNKIYNQLPFHEYIKNIIKKFEKYHEKITTEKNSEGKNVLEFDIEFLKKMIDIRNNGTTTIGQDTTEIKKYMENSTERDIRRDIRTKIINSLEEVNPGVNFFITHDNPTFEGYLSKVKIDDIIYLVTKKLMTHIYTLSNIQMTVPFLSNYANLSKFFTTEDDINRILKNTNTDLHIITSTEFKNKFSNSKNMEQPVKNELNKYKENIDAINENMTAIITEYMSTDTENTLENDINAIEKIFKGVKIEKDNDFYNKLKIYLSIANYYSYHNNKFINDNESFIENFEYWDEQYKFFLSPKYKEIDSQSAVAYKHCFKPGDFNEKYNRLINRAIDMHDITDGPKNIFFKAFGEPYKKYFGVYSNRAKHRSELSSIHHGLTSYIGLTGNMLSMSILRKKSAIELELFKASQDQNNQDTLSEKQNNYTNYLSILKSIPSIKLHIEPKSDSNIGNMIKENNLPEFFNYNIYEEIANLKKDEKVIPAIRSRYNISFNNDTINDFDKKNLTRWLSSPYEWLHKYRKKHMSFKLSFINNLNYNIDELYNFKKQSKLFKAIDIRPVFAKVLESTLPGLDSNVSTGLNITVSNLFEQIEKIFKSTMFDYDNKEKPPEEHFKNFKIYYDFLRNQDKIENLKFIPDFTYVEENEEHKFNVRSMVKLYKFYFYMIKWYQHYATCYYITANKSNNETVPESLGTGSDTGSGTGSGEPEVPTCNPKGKSDNIDDLYVHELNNSIARKFKKYKYNDVWVKDVSNSKVHKITSLSLKESMYYCIEDMVQFGTCQHQNKEYVETTNIKSVNNNATIPFCKSEEMETLIKNFTENISTYKIPKFYLEKNKEMQERNYKHRNPFYKTETYYENFYKMYIASLKNITTKSSINLHDDIDILYRWMLTSTTIRLNQNDVTGGRLFNRYKTHRPLNIEFIKSSTYYSKLVGRSEEYISGGGSDDDEPIREVEDVEESEETGIIVDLAESSYEDTDDSLNLLVSKILKRSLLGTSLNFSRKFGSFMANMAYIGVDENEPEPQEPEPQEPEQQQQPPKGGQSKKRVKKTKPRSVKKRNIRNRSLKR